MSNDARTAGLQQSGLLAKISADDRRVCGDEATTKGKGSTILLDQLREQERHYERLLQERDDEVAVLHDQNRSLEFQAQSLQRTLSKTSEENHRLQQMLEAMGEKLRTFQQLISECNIVMDSAQSRIKRSQNRFPSVYDIGSATQSEAEAEGNPHVHCTALKDKERRHSAHSSHVRKLKRTRLTHSGSDSSIAGSELTCKGTGHNITPVPKLRSRRREKLYSKRSRSLLDLLHIDVEGGSSSDITPRTSPAPSVSSVGGSSSMWSLPITDVHDNQPSAQKALKRIGRVPPRSVSLQDNIQIPSEHSHRWSMTLTLPEETVQRPSTLVTYSEGHTQTVSTNKSNMVIMRSPPTPTSSTIDTTSMQYARQLSPLQAVSGISSTGEDSTDERVHKRIESQWPSGISSTGKDSTDERVHKRIESQWPSGVSSAGEDSTDERVHKRIESQWPVSIPATGHKTTTSTLKQRPPAPPPQNVPHMQPHVQPHASPDVAIDPTLQKRLEQQRKKIESGKPGQHFQQLERSKSTMIQRKEAPTDELKEKLAKRRFKAEPSKT